MVDLDVASLVRVCTVCRTSKPATLEFFYRHTGAAKRGLHPRCKACFAAYAKQHKDRNREGKAAACRRYYDRNAEARRLEARQRAARTRAERPELVRAWKARERAKIKDENGVRLARKRMSQLVFASIKNRLGGGKAGRRWTELVGYELPELMRHVERQFTKGMSWENWGKAWHLDHIQPVKSFCITGLDCPEFRACWTLSNLRPLSIAENLSKGSSRTLLL